MLRRGRGDNGSHEPARLRLKWAWPVLAFLALVGGGCEGGEQRLELGWQDCGGGVAQPCPYRTATLGVQGEATRMAAVPMEQSMASPEHGGLAKALLLPPVWTPLNSPLAPAAQVAATVPPFDPGGWAYAANSGPLGEPELRALLAEAGSPPEWVEPLVAIALCESRGRPDAVGDAGASLGTWQIWVGWFFEGEDPFDPLTNARVAIRIRETRGRFGGGGGWTCAGILGIE